MEAVLLILLIVILFLVLNVKNRLSEKFDGLQQKIDELSEAIRKNGTSETIGKREQTLADDEEIVQAFKESTRPQPPTKAPEPVKVFESVEEPAEVISFSDLISAPSTAKAEPTQPPKPGFFERNPDLEKFIGENLANKIGIGILVLGIGFFVKYAIDQDWINEIGRVFIGLLAGGILLGVAHKMRKSFTAFSSVLVGGGLAVLYLTIGIAFHEYEIFSQTVAFIIMVIITAFAVLLSLGYNRVELAVLALLGGFASPFMVSTGEGNYVVLFTYVLILDAGMLVLAYFKKWNLVNVISYIFTVLLFGTWLGVSFEDDNSNMIVGGVVFATLFYLVFFAMNIINNLKQRSSFKNLDIMLLLSNTFLFYAAGMTLLSNASGDDYKGLFTVLLAVFNFVFAYALHRSGRVDKQLVYLLIGLVLTFISLAAPVQLEGNYITLFWSAEAVLLLWLSQKSGIRLMKLASVAITALMIISLVMDWSQLYGTGAPGDLSIIVNKAYVTGFVSVISLILTYRLLRNETSEDLEIVKIYRMAVLGALVVVLYVVDLLELRYQLVQYGFGYESQNVIIGAYNMAFIGVLLMVSKRLTVPEVSRRGIALLGVAAMLSYLFFYHSQIIIVRNDFINGYGAGVIYFFHYLFIVLLLSVAAISLTMVRQWDDFNRKTYNLYSWFYVFFFVFLASAELDHLVVVSSFSAGDSLQDILNQNHKIGYPILWGVTSFALISLGLKQKIRHLRIISLTLFLVTLIKLFLIDIRGISEGGKIAAFISLGVLLLIVSFMYQRLKKILLADSHVVEGSPNKTNV
jgi:uncharacterized membrane protein